MNARPLVIAAGHPAYAGHFPGRPILPAVVLLAEALAEVAALTGKDATHWSLQQAKFARPVSPGEALTLACDGAANGTMRFEIRAGDALVASGSFAAS